MIWELTGRQEEIYEHLTECIAKGFTPTIRELGAKFGIRSTAGVSDHLVALERKGFIRREPRRSRIYITGKKS